MMKLEINSTEWRIFCEKFTQLNQGSLMSVEMIDPGGRTEDVAQELSFQKMTLDTTDACNDVISISLLHKSSLFIHKIFSCSGASMTAANFHSFIQRRS
jgi:hypothetical protein